VGFFKRKSKDEDLDLATVIGRRGIPATGVLHTMQPTGRTKEGGTAREFEFRVSFAPHGLPPVEVTVRQFLNEVNATGLAPGEQVSVLYDRQNAETCVVVGSPQYRIVGDGVAVKVDGPASGLSRDSGWSV
jgi:hypothetical protein